MRHDRASGGTPASSREERLASRGRVQEDPEDRVLEQRPGLRPSGVVRSYVTMLGVMGGALAAASVASTHEAQASGHLEGLDGGIAPVASIGHIIADGPDPAPASPNLLPAQSAAGEHDELAGLNKSLRLDEERAAAEAEAARQREAAEREALRNRVVWPVAGRITSMPGARWGTTHYGLDIANRIGTPIYAVKRGVVIDAGPASGFGLWVRLRHPDGTTTVYGHINRTLVSKGESVEAGEVIAEVGNRGQSTGPHLHFEVWDANSRKVNPYTWLRNNGARA
ncbi:M23 family metallopeptidase [Saccharopolyspora indica]|uniref:M23 family metallopeptidase n=1 Tax=Saccharopolyspora indica TaxID=1229659 RepID=UPI002FE5A478